MLYYDFYKCYFTGKWFVKMTKKFISLFQGCVTLIHWHTRLACENPIHCATSLLGHQTDLSPLIAVTQNYRIELPDKRAFFINICRPLLPQTGLNCGAGAAACVALRRSGSLMEELNLGFATSAPTVTADGALLIYSGGSPCPRRPAVNATTRISFKCNPLIGNVRFLIIFNNKNYKFN